MATHSSVLAWSIPWTEEPGRLQCLGSQGPTGLLDGSDLAHTPKDPLQGLVLRGAVHFSEMELQSVRSAQPSVRAKRWFSSPPPQPRPSPESPSPLGLRRSGEGETEEGESGVAPGSARPAVRPRERRFSRGPASVSAGG